MKLTPTEIRAVVYLTRRYRESGATLPASVAALSARLETAVLHGEASPWRQSERLDDSDLEHVEYIGTKLAAQLLGWNVRRVQRHAADLGGHMVGDRLVYPAHVVEEYRNHLEGSAECPS